MLNELKIKYAKNCVPHVREGNRLIPAWQQKALPAPKQSDGERLLHLAKNGFYRAIAERGSRNVDTGWHYTNPLHSLTQAEINHIYQNKDEFFNECYIVAAELWDRKKMAQWHDGAVVNYFGMYFTSTIYRYWQRSSGKTTLAVKVESLDSMAESGADRYEDALHYSVDLSDTDEYMGILDEVKQRVSATEYQCFILQGMGYSRREVCDTLHCSPRVVARMRDKVKSYLESRIQA